jgi:hypothetical protein
MLVVGSSLLLTRQIGIGNWHLFALLLSSALAVSKFYRHIQPLLKAFELAFSQLLQSL